MFDSLGHVIGVCLGRVGGFVLTMLLGFVLTMLVEFAACIGLWLILSLFILPVLCRGRKRFVSDSEGDISRVENC